LLDKVADTLDCAPLSFLQTIRHLISAEVDSDGFAIQATRDAMIENASPELSSGQRPALPRDSMIEALVCSYCVATSGLVDLFGQSPKELAKEISSRSSITSCSDDAATAVDLLVLAIGWQENGQGDESEQWFTHSRELLLRHMCRSMNVATAQGFTLVAVYMLRSFQPNGAYLYFCK